MWGRNEELMQQRGKYELVSTSLKFCRHQNENGEFDINLCFKFLVAEVFVCNLLCIIAGRMQEDVSSFEITQATESHWRPYLTQHAPSVAAKVR